MSDQVLSQLTEKQRQARTAACRLRRHNDGPRGGIFTADFVADTAVHLLEALEARERELGTPSETKFQIPPGLHPKTADLVIRFATALAEKLRKAEEKYDYDDGWTGSAWMVECQQRLAEHVAKGDPRDVAAYCAFMWHHGWPTAPKKLETDRRSLNYDRLDK